jgi:hypothetical protein
MCATIMSPGTIDYAARAVLDLGRPRSFGVIVSVVQALEKLAGERRTLPVWQREGIGEGFVAGGDDVSIASRTEAGNSRAFRPPQSSTVRTPVMPAPT